MVTNLSNSHQVTALAERIVVDICQRGLGPGDRYFTTADVAKMLGVRKSAVNQALSYLASRSILVRRQRSGTYIGSNFENRDRVRVRTVHTLFANSDQQAGGWKADAIVCGIREELSDVNVQFSYVPQQNSLAYVRELIGGSQSLGQLAGVVPASCSSDVYEYLANLNVPVVVCGSLYTPKPALMSIDIDNHQSGELMAGYLLEKNHGRMALLTTGKGRPGDNAFYDGVSRVLAAAHMKHDALIQRLVPADAAIIETVARELFAMPNPPTAVIARSSLIGHAVLNAAKACGLSIPNDLEIVFQADAPLHQYAPMPNCPYVAPKITFREVAARVGQMLKQQMEEKVAESQSVVVPVQFYSADGVAEPT